MAINFPPPTTTGEIYTDPSSSRTWKWNGKAWEGTASNAFLMDNMTEGTTTKILTDSERTLIGSAIQTETNGTVQGTGATTYNIVATDEGAFASTTSRGEKSVDLQINRNAVDQVTEGVNSALIAGANNKATNNASSVLGGVSNTSSGYASPVLGGFNNVASGSNSICLSGRDQLADADFTLTAGNEARCGSFAGARVFGDSSGVAVTAIQADEFTIQGSTLRLIDGNQGIGKVLTTDGSGRGNWGYIDGVGDSVTGTATFTNASNQIGLTGIDQLHGLAIGDVIEVTGSANGDNDKAFTVSLIGVNTIDVNQAHKGNSSSALNKSLREEPSTAGVTVTLTCKARYAPIGYGQAWVAVGGRTIPWVNYTNSTGRTILHAVRSQSVTDLTFNNIFVDDVRVDMQYAGVAAKQGIVQALCPAGSKVKIGVDSNTTVGWDTLVEWKELT